MSKLTNRALYSRLLKVADQNDIKVREVDNVPNNSRGMFIRDNKGLKAILISNQLEGLLQKIFSLAYLMGCSVLPFGTGYDISEIADEEFGYEAGSGIITKLYIDGPRYIQIAEAVAIRNQLLNCAHIPDVFNCQRKVNKLESCIIHNDSTPEAISNFIFQDNTKGLFDGLLEAANKSGIYVEDFEQCKHPGINGAFATRKNDNGVQTKVIILSDALELKKKVEVLAYLVGCSIFIVPKPVNALRPVHMRDEGAERQVRTEARKHARNLLDSFKNNDGEDVFKIEPFIAAEQLQPGLNHSAVM